MTQKSVLKLVAVGIASFALGAGASLILAWNGPTAAPSGGNASAPLNVGDNIQVKTGGLSLGRDLRVGGAVNVGESLTTGGSLTVQGWKLGRNSANGFFVSAGEEGQATQTWINGATIIGSIPSNPLANLVVNGTVQILGGNPGEGKILASDQNGVASWIDLPSGGGANVPSWVTNPGGNNTVPTVNQNGNVEWKTVPSGGNNGNGGNGGDNGSCQIQSGIIPFVRKDETKTVVFPSAFPSGVIPVVVATPQTSTAQVYIDVISNTGFNVTPQANTSIQYIALAGSNCASVSSGPNGVTQITAGNNIAISPQNGTGNVTINANVPANADFPPGSWCGFNGPSVKNISHPQQNDRTTILCQGKDPAAQGCPDGFTQVSMASPSSIAGTGALIYSCVKN